MHIILLSDDPLKKKPGILRTPFKSTEDGSQKETFSFWTMTEKGILMNILAHVFHFLAASGIQEPVGHN